MPQVQFSQDGNFLYTGARQDGNILCWDIRNAGDVLYAMQRDTRSTNQRVQFSIEPGGRHLTTGEMCSRKCWMYTRRHVSNCSCVKVT